MCSTVMPFFPGRLRQFWEAGIRTRVSGPRLNVLRSDLVSTPGFVVTQIYESIACRRCDYWRVCRLQRGA